MGPWAVILVALVVLGGKPVESYNCNLTQYDVDELASEIRYFISTNLNPDEYGVPYQSFVATFVRLSFHMCVSGRCDGCINLADSNNKHLDVAITALVNIKAQYNSCIGYADLIALAGIVALNIGEDQAYATSVQPFSNYTYGIQFRYGRTDCATAPYTSGIFNFPAHTGGLQHIVYWFDLYLNFQWWETVTIMGFHKLGGLKKGNSNVLFAQWTYGPDVLDNAYYKDLVDSSLGWAAGNVSVSGYTTPYYIWRQKPMNSRVMFNCDMSLYYTLTFGWCNPYSVTCNLHTCVPEYRTADLVSLYASNNNLWLTEASIVFSKMIETGFTSPQLHPPL